MMTGKLLLALLPLFIASASLADDFQVIHQDGKPYRHMRLADRLEEQIPLQPVAGRLFRPYPGEFGLTIKFAGAGTCRLQRAIELEPSRIGTLSGGINMALTVGTTEVLRPDMYVSGLGLLAGTRIASIVDETHFTLTSSGIPGSNKVLSFWTIQQTITADQPGLLINWPLGYPWRIVYNGGGTALTVWEQ